MNWPLRLLMLCMRLPTYVGALAAPVLRVPRSGVYAVRACEFSLAHLKFSAERPIIPLEAMPVHRCALLVAVPVIMLGSPAPAKQQRNPVLPVTFEPNVGQTEAPATFLAKGQGFTVFLHSTGATLRTRRSLIRMDLVQANAEAEAVACEPLPGRVNYLLGADPSGWHTGIPTYGRVDFRNVYPGISLAYYSSQGRVEYDFVVSPRADPSSIRLRFEGTEQIRIGPDGGLFLPTADGDFIHQRPLVYQSTATGRKSIRARYVQKAGNEIGFELGDYDRSQTLIIDPLIVFSTYLGGRGYDTATGIAVDTTGNAYITGWTESTDLAGSGSTRLGSSGGVDAFVAKMNSSGSSLVYMTYIGGSGDDRAFGIAVDHSGSAVITGATHSGNFPTLNPVRRTLSGPQDAFIAKLSSNGASLVFSTYWGGSGADAGNGIAIDTSGNIYITGATDSSDLPTLNAFQSNNAGIQDAFVTKFSAAGAVQYSTYIGGLASDVGNAIAVDASGCAYITGGTYSTNFPTVSAVQGSNRGGQDAFVIKLNATGNALVYSTYLGGSGGSLGAPEMGTGIALDAGGAAYVTGDTSSLDFPAVNAYQSSLHGGSDAFVVKLTAAGTTLAYSTYLGGYGVDFATAVAVDDQGDCYVVGYTASHDFPTANSLQPSLAGTYNAFLVQLLPSGAAVAFGTYVGGKNSDAAYALALDASGSAYLVGSTSSIDFPTYATVQTYIAGTLSAFVAKIGGLSSAGITNPTLTSPSTSTVLAGGDVTFTWNAVNGSQDYWVDIGTTVGAGDISSGSTGGALFKTVDISQHLGQIIYVQLYSSRFGVSWSPGTGNRYEFATSSPPSGTNLAQGMMAAQSSTICGGDPSRAVDGNTNGNFSAASVSHTNADANAWWEVDLGRPATINGVAIWGRTDCCSDRLGDYWVFVSSTPFAATDTPATLQTRAGTWSSHQTLAPNPFTIVLPGVQGEYVRIQLSGTNYVSLAEVQVVGASTDPPSNLAQGMTATQSSTIFGGDPSRVVDGNTNGNFSAASVSHTNAEANAWWQVDLGALGSISRIVIWGRTDCCGDRLGDYWVFVSNTPFSPADTSATLQGRSGVWSSHQSSAPAPFATLTLSNTLGRYVRVQLTGTNYLSLAEVQVFGWVTTQTDLALSKVASQSSTIFGGDASRAVDGNSSGDFSAASVSHTNADAYAWWQVDLGASATVSIIAVWNRTDCCSDRLSDYWVFISNTPFSSSDTPATLQGRADVWSSHQTEAPAPATSISTGGTHGRYVRVQLSGTNYLSLSEVQVMGNW